jgi:hypothetical protein
MLALFTLFVFFTGMLFFPGATILSASEEAELQEDELIFPDEELPGYLELSEEEYEEPIEEAGIGEEIPGEETEEPEEGEQTEPDYR